MSDKTVEEGIVNEFSEVTTIPTQTIQVDGKTYRITPKFRKWVELYNDPNSETHGNGVQSVIKAYGLDPKTQYESAETIVTENLGKLGHIVRDYAERSGLTLHQFWRVAFKNAIDMNRTDQKEWWKIVGKQTGFSSEKDAPGVQVNIQNNVQNNTQVNMSKEDQTDWNAKFKEFLEKQ